MTAAGLEPARRCLVISASLRCLSRESPAGAAGQLYGVGGSSDALGLIGLKNQQDQWNKAYQQANNQFNQPMSFNQDSFNKSFNLAQSQYDNSNMWQQKFWDYNTDASGRGADAAAYTNAFVSGLKPVDVQNGDHINPWEMMGIPGGASAGRCCWCLLYWRS